MLLDTFIGIVPITGHCVVVIVSLIAVTQIEYLRAIHTCRSVGRTETDEYLFKDDDEASVCVCDEQRRNQCAKRNKKLKQSNSVWQNKNKRGGGGGGMYVYLDSITAFKIFIIGPR
jgi:hypothetical protein